MTQAEARKIVATTGLDPNSPRLREANAVLAKAKSASLAKTKQQLPYRTSSTRSATRPSRGGTRPAPPVDQRPAPGEPDPPPLRGDSGPPARPPGRSYDPPVITPPQEVLPPLPQSGTGTVPTTDQWQRPPLPDYNDYPFSTGHGTATPMPSASQLGFQTAEPLQMAEQNRIANRAWWEKLDQDVANSQNRYQDYENYFRNRALEGGWAGGYGDILSGRGGYAPQEQQDIIQGGMLESGLATPDQLRGIYLSPQEQASIAGSPFAARDLAAGQMQYLGDVSAGGEQRQREAADYMGRLYEDATVGMAGQLGVNEAYLPAQTQNIANTATGYSEIVDPRYLGVSDEFWGRYDVTPRDQQNLKDAAARREMIGSQAQNDALERRAAAQGNTSPLAIAAAQNRARLYGRQNAADAALNADIAAKQLGLNTAMSREGVRVGAERDIANRGTGALQHLSGMTADTLRDYENMRQNAARDVSNRMIQRAADEGRTRTALEGDIARNAVDVGKYQTGTMIGLTADAEQEAARRSADLAQNRQTTGQYGIGTAFAQRFPASQALSDRYRGVYDTRKGEEREGRGFLTGQQGAAQEGAIATRQQGIGAAGTAMGGIGDATAASIQAKYIPGFFEKAGAFLGG